MRDQETEISPFEIALAQTAACVRKVILCAQKICLVKNGKNNPNKGSRLFIDTAVVLRKSLSIDVFGILDSIPLQYYTIIIFNIIFIDKI